MFDPTNENIRRLLKSKYMENLRYSLEDSYIYIFIIALISLCAVIVLLNIFYFAKIFVFIDDWHLLLVLVPLQVILINILLNTNWLNYRKIRDSDYEK